MKKDYSKLHWCILKPYLFDFTIGWFFLGLYYGES